jgi:hypothetical protein
MNTCIIWEGPVWSQGRYGMDKINGKSMGAHRAAWIRKYGEIDNGLVVCHKCDNGLCINTDHLFLGTPKDNMQDCSRKGRLNKPCQKGNNNNNAKKSYEDYINIQKDRLLGMTYSKLRLKYGLKSNGHLRQILLYKIQN